MAAAAVAGRKRQGRAARLGRFRRRRSRSTSRPTWSSRTCARRSAKACAAVARARRRARRSGSAPMRAPTSVAAIDVRAAGRHALAPTGFRADAAQRRRTAAAAAAASRSASSSCARWSPLRRICRSPSACAATSPASMPRGTLQNGAIEWSGNVEAPTRYSVKAGFRKPRRLRPHGRHARRDAIFRQRSTRANATGGVRIDERGGDVALPRLFAEPVAFDTSARRRRLAARRATATQVQLKDVAFANADVAGTTSRQVALACRRSGRRSTSRRS